MTSLYQLFLPTQNFEFYLPHQVNVFEMMITPEREYPMILTGVKKSFDPTDDLKLDLVNLNSSASWFEDDATKDGMSTVVPRQQQLKITSATQLDKESILICYESEHFFPLPHRRTRHCVLPDFLIISFHLLLVFLLVLVFRSSEIGESAGKIEI